MGGGAPEVKEVEEVNEVEEAKHLTGYEERTQPTVAEREFTTESAEVTEFGVEEEFMANTTPPTPGLICV